MAEVRETESKYFQLPFLTERSANWKQNKTINVSFSLFIREWKSKGQITEHHAHYTE